MKTSKRLKAIEAMVRPGSKAADIGCDHGKLACRLALSGRCPKVIAADLRQGPLSAAAALVKELELEDKVELRLTDGLCGIGPEDAEDIIIAGIGADETAKIISAAKHLKDPRYRLILAPASRHGRLREYLMRQGFAAVRELAVYDMGQYYTVIAAEYTGTTREPGVAERELGSITPDTADGAGYWNRVLERTKKILQGKLSGADPDSREITQLQQLVTYIEGELNGNQQ